MTFSLKLARPSITMEKWRLAFLDSTPVNVLSMFSVITLLQTAALQKPSPSVLLTAKKMVTPKSPAPA
ncbi:hypothetical protein DOP00_23590, partial [Salmonella enterica]|nr:hypothetical protein [Salmonella enterica]